MSDAVTLAIPAYVEKQIAPLRKEIEALKEQVRQLTEKPAKESGWLRKTRRRVGHA